jgi:succinate dehydrogenase flavin-adding protein (antitoxin of CptAB toxin-antitoxin module)
MEYDITNKYLYEILDDYKDAVSEEEKDIIVKSFMKLIWSSKNKRNTYLKDIRFSVTRSLLETDIGKIFNTYTEISYTGYKSMIKDTDFVSLIRQKINNLYTNLCDEEVCLKKEYMDLLKKPKQMYYRWKNGEEFDPESLKDCIENILEQSVKVKEKYSKQKMKITWNDYKKIITPYFKRMFDNFIPLEQYEDKTVLTLTTDLWCEDNYCIAYLCKGLDGYMRDYQKQYYGIKKQRNMKLSRCGCGNMFIKNNNKHKYCPSCKKLKTLEKHIKYNNKRNDQ